MDEGKLQKGNRTNLSRRRFSTGACLGLLAALAGCGGSEDPPTDQVTTALPASPRPQAAPVTWDVVSNRAIAIPPGATFDLAATLPPTVAPGGVFEVDPSGAALPAGVSLHRTGVLAVSNSATGGTTGVVFRYTPPA